jgi:ABC-2 type transport system ATP-binding protein
MRIIAGQEFPSAGQLRVLGASPAENEQVLRRTVFIREDQAYPDFKVGHALRVASWFYPNWSSELAGTLLADFALPLNRHRPRPAHPGPADDPGPPEHPAALARKLT